MNAPYGLVELCDGKVGVAVIRPGQGSNCRNRRASGCAKELSHNIIPGF